MRFIKGQRVQLRPGSGNWMAHVSGPVYLELTDRPTGTITAVQDDGRGGQEIYIAIDGSPIVRSWLFGPEAAEPYNGPTRNARTIDGTGKPIDPSTIKMDAKNDQ